MRCGIFELVNDIGILAGLYRIGSEVDPCGSFAFLIASRARFVLVHKSHAKDADGAYEIGLWSTDVDVRAVLDPF